MVPRPGIDGLTGGLSELAPIDYSAPGVLVSNFKEIAVPLVAEASSVTCGLDP